MLSKQQIAKLCFDEREQLLQKYVTNLPEDVALPLSRIGEIIEQMEDEYRQFLSGLWEQVRNNDTRSLDEILDKRYNRYILTCEYAKDISVSQAAAEEITLWEQIADTNIHDIRHLNALIYTYAKDLLAHITLDFTEDVESSSK